LRPAWATQGDPGLKWPDPSLKKTKKSDFKNTQPIVSKHSMAVYFLHKIANILLKLMLNFFITFYLFKQSLSNLDLKKSLKVGGSIQPHIFFGRFFHI
jgi:hypothetical protein